ncbi:hypothetical protein MCOR02_010452 [Pyricularia oryzae]|uniref:Uncharacterized protein n=1 Tax=Pyricularia oryzae TaxID=318829 RepID=A0A4P7NNT3_PYROR|nr:hypothetical protein MCOR02_010452 [Pyricularia oryzae]QBZ63802.1 hypothetical protein PoMZ_05492 [Pyricularia oryzae]
MERTHSFDIQPNVHMTTLVAARLSKGLRLRSSFLLWPFPSDRTRQTSKESTDRIASISIILPILVCGTVSLQGCVNNIIAPMFDPLRSKRVVRAWSPCYSENDDFPPSAALFSLGRFHPLGSWFFYQSTNKSTDPIQYRIDLGRHPKV